MHSNRSDPSSPEQGFSGGRKRLIEVGPGLDLVLVKPEKAGARYAADLSAEFWLIDDIHSRWSSGLHNLAVPPVPWISPIARYGVPKPPNKYAEGLAFLERCVPIPPSLAVREVITLVAELLKGLAAVYAVCGVINTDIKPGNVMLGATGPRSRLPKRLVVVDWGLGTVLRRDSGVGGMGADKFVPLSPGLGVGVNAFIAPPELLKYSAGGERSLEACPILTYQMAALLLCLIVPHATIKEALDNKHGHSAVDARGQERFFIGQDTVRVLGDGFPLPFKDLLVQALGPDPANRLSSELFGKALLGFVGKVT
ncbi:hypothetical protein H6802_01080 [Candidatus Nomurabacteria bacterium]|uniref:Protein kinase domain-containing protein n=1 Tax=candidate division WWE3 bacterium TaxID=2053526 RepID=A0A955E039_UNCKA|nr:hypothetical protein [candidate division WWE3 bacterium]MCB9823536.1 hypothetical protein [Candidatus Nomurabacteria bacterium]MCB9827331.1 hypothetical protein [Candidatus Nomurabacteria bacterium]HXK52487.1 hypothetical protein [bacterium]